MRLFFRNAEGDDVHRCSFGQQRPEGARKTCWQSMGNSGGCTDGCRTTEVLSGDDFIVLPPPFSDGGSLFHETTVDSSWTLSGNGPRSIGMRYNTCSMYVWLPSLPICYLLRPPSTVQVLRGHI